MSPAYDCFDWCLSRFKGGKDRNGKFKGRGQIEFENGDLITGMFDNSIRHGECRVETFRHGLRVIIGTYIKDKLCGKAKVVYDDDTWLEGYFKEGVLHGFVRRFDGKGRLTFVGIYRYVLYLYGHGILFSAV